MNRLKKTNKKIKGTKKRTKINWVERKLPESIPANKYELIVSFTYAIPSIGYDLTLVIPAKYSMRDFLQILRDIRIDNGMRHNTDAITPILMLSDIPKNFILPMGEDILVYVHKQIAMISNNIFSRVIDFKPYIYLIGDIYEDLLGKMLLAHKRIKEEWLDIPRYKYHYASAYIEDSLDRLLVHPDNFEYPFENITDCDNSIIQDADIEIHHEYQPSSYHRYYKDIIPHSSKICDKMIVYKPPPFEYLTKSL